MVGTGDEVVRANRKAKRKKSAAQIKAEATAQLDDATGALRTIYRQLDSALHPDCETDQAEQVRKTALMKEATCPKFWVHFTNTAYLKA